MTSKSGAAAADTNLGAHNYREWAGMVVAKYGDKRMVADAMIWSSIVGYYERDRADLLEALQGLMVTFPSDPIGHLHGRNQCPGVEVGKPCSTACTKVRAVLAKVSRGQMTTNAK